MGKTVRNAFTLIELLVVIAIMAVLSVYALANYRDFGEDQKLKNSALDIQSLLRQAQTNSSVNAKCNDQTGATTWRVNFVNSDTLNLECKSPSSGNFVTIKTLTLPNPPTIGAISADDCATYPGSTPFTIDFKPLTVTPLLSWVEISGVSDICDSVTVNLANTRITKSVVIERGGRIYVE